MPEEEIALEEVVDVSVTPKLVLYNDDYNSFPHVIKCLMKYCKHSQEQAEQNAWLVHFKGQALVKSGGFIKLKPICEALCENGLNAKIEEE